MRVIPWNGLAIRRHEKKVKFFLIQYKVYTKSYVNLSEPNDRLFQPSFSLKNSSNVHLFIGFAELIIK